MEDKKLLQLVSDIGFDMLSYGGEIYRVEETVKRICFAYGIEIVDVFAIPSTISVSITRQEETYSRTRRIISKGTDLDKVDQLNNLSRQLCREKPDYISAKEMLRQIRTGDHNGYIAAADDTVIDLPLQRGIEHTFRRQDQSAQPLGQDQVVDPVLDLDIGKVFG